MVLAQKRQENVQGDCNQGIKALWTLGANFAPMRGCSWVTIIDLSRSESRTHFLLDSAGISEVTLQLTRGLNFIKREVVSKKKYQHSMIT